VGGEVEFVADGRCAEGKVVAVADIDCRVAQLLAGSRATNVGAGFDEQRGEARTGQISGGGEAVVAGTDDYCVEGVAHV